MNLRSEVDLERVYYPLLGASDCSREGGAEGVLYDVIVHWFTECGIIDPLFIPEAEFNHAYQRLCPNLEPLSLVQFIQLMGILARQLHRALQDFTIRFDSVRDTLVDEVVEARRRAGGYK